MMSPLISVIVPVYKVEKYLDRCVESVLAQDFSDFELILVDDGSPDRCREMCDEWSTRDTRIRTFHKANGGQAGARNSGLDHARGEYIAFVDSDDWVTPDYLSYLLSLRASDAMFVACNHTIIRNGRKTMACNIGTSQRILTRKEAYNDVLFHGCMDVAPWGKLYKKEIFIPLRYPEGRLFEDTWLFGDILNQTQKVVFGNKSCYFYEMHEGSTVNQSFREKNLEYIEAAEKLSKDAVAADENNKLGGLRRVNHARLSVLRYMGDCEEKYKKLREQLRKQILADAPKYINDLRTPKRDRIAIMLLRLGLREYYFGWNIYSKLRP